MNGRAIPKLYDSSDDAWFDDETPSGALGCPQGETDADAEDEPTLPRAGAAATGVRAFFETVVRKLESRGRRIG
jgi:hypothetical protein